VGQHEAGHRPADRAVILFIACWRDPLVGGASGKW
jgi:hypothetical protein